MLNFVSVKTIKGSSSAQGKLQAQRKKREINEFASDRLMERELARD
jgi:hypothetical protein